MKWAFGAHFRYFAKISSPSRRSNVGSVSVPMEAAAAGRMAALLLLSNEVIKIFLLRSLRPPNTRQDQAGTGIDPVITEQLADIIPAHPTSPSKLKIPKIF